MHPIKSFQAARWIRTANLVLQAVLFITLFLGLNYLAIHHSWRTDLTRLRTHSLSPETLSYIRKLEQPIKVYVTIPKPKDSDDSPIAQAYLDLTDLLREYVYASEGNANGSISFEYIDVYQRGREAKELGLTAPGPTLVISGDKRHLIGVNELYLIDIDKGEKKAFLGEQALTAAILDVSSAEKKKIYFLTGHGEMDLGDTSEALGLSTLATELRIRNFELDRLDLTAQGRVPKQATLIISAGQRTRYSAAEEELLRQYLATSTSDRPGRLLLFLPPGLPVNAQNEATGLENLLYDWGILADDVVVKDINPASINDTEDLILNAFSEKHEISKYFLDNQIKVRFGAARSVRVNPSRASDESLTVTPLIGTNSRTAWGERSYTIRFMYNPGIDMPYNLLGFGVASERVSAKDKKLPYSVQAGRVVAYACSDFISNNRLSNDGNFALVLSSINWLVGGGTQLNNVPARPIQKFQLNLNQQELLRLRYSLLLILPSAAALLGLIVYWTRRR
jgi:hypothetical protein